MVLVHHAARFLPGEPARALSAAGWSGVDLFFVISGFVVGASLLRTLPQGPGALGRIRSAGPWLLAFARRRALRLWPLAWGTTLLAWLLAVALGGEFGTGSQLAREAISVFTCTYNFFALDHVGERLAWYWSLGVEEQFYAVLPLLLLATGTRRLQLALAALGVLLPVLLRPWEVPSAPEAFEAWRYPPWARADALFAGVLLATWRHGRADAAVAASRRSAGLASWALAAAIFLLPALAPFGWALGGGATVLTLLSAALVLLAARGAGDVLPLPGGAGLLEWMGARSYALYLLHPLALRLALRGELPPGATLLAFSLLTLAAADLAHRHVERPLLA